jgi:SAM-dependent methyltransferase
MSSPQNDYISVIYNQKDRPFTEYPDLLAKYLTSRYHLKQHCRLLEVGCGRGEFLRGFIRQGLKGYGTDQSDAATRLCPEAEIKVANLEEGLPYDDDFFDVVYSKSVIEHFYYPEKVITEISRVLKPKGQVIILTPDWTHVYKTFYEDYTHRTPFTITSLRDIMLIHGFEQVQVEEFFQLPIIWKLPWVKLLSMIVSFFAPKSLAYKFKFVRFSKEVMLLSSAIKPG